MDWHPHPYHTIWHSYPFKDHTSQQLFMKIHGVICYKLYKFTQRRMVFGVYWMVNEWFSSPSRIKLELETTRVILPTKEDHSCEEIDPLLQCWYHQYVHQFQTKIKEAQLDVGLWRSKKQARMVIFMVLNFLKSSNWSQLQEKQWCARLMMYMRDWVGHCQSNEGGSMVTEIVQIFVIFFCHCNTTVL